MCRKLTDLKRWHGKWLTVRVFFSSFLICFFYMQNAAQETSVKFNRLSTEHGLSQSSVTCIFQDDEGFMWFGTYGGLSRFDGYNFIVNQFTPANKYTISDNHVRSICQDTAGILILATVNGLNRYFTETRQFIGFFHDPEDSASLAHNTIYKVLKDKDGDIWIGTWGGGLDKMERKTGKYDDERDARYRFIHHRPQEGKNSISSLHIADMTESPDGSLWIATNKGLNHYNKEKNEFTVYLNDSRNTSGISSNDVNSVCVDKNGNVWAGTWGGGLNMFNPQTKKFTRYLHNRQDPYSISHDIVMELFCDNSGQIWAGTWGGGLNKSMTAEEHGKLFPGKEPDENILFVRYQHEANDLWSISSNTIYSIYEDQTGVMWVGADLGGVNRFEKTQAKFRIVRSEPSNPNSLTNNKIFSILLDKKNILWIGTQDGLNVYDKNTKKYTHFKYNPDNPSSISHNVVRSIVEDPDGTIWLGTLLGLNKYDPKNRNFKRYYIDPDNPSANNIISLQASRNGEIWVGTYEYGLYLFDPKNEQFIKYENKLHETKNLGNEIIWSIIEDEKGNLWIGSHRNGLYYIDPDGEKFVNYQNIPEDTTTLSNNYVLTLLPDHENNLWVGTSLGLNKLSFDATGKPIFISYFEEDGLAAQTVNGIVEDEFGHLWITTAKGLSMLDPAANLFTNYYQEDGLQDIEFSINAICRNKETGEIYAGGINGFNVFQPGRVMGNKTPPIAKIVDLRIFNRSVHIGDEVNNRIILDKVISSVQTLELSHREYVISFEFAALHYQSPQGNQYAFMLKGFDKDWNYVKNQRLATYTNLSPGRYTFLVKAANNDGVWNPIPTKLQLYIRPPWWKTILFRIAAVLTAIMAGTIFFRLRIRILKKRQLQLEEMVRKRTEELSKANGMLAQKQEEITQVNTLLEEKQEEITMQNEELLKHRNDLEDLVDMRTAELREAKVKAEESDKLKSSFLANMSHEIRTPMNAIVGFASLLDDDTIDQTEKSYFIQTIKNNSDILLTLINDILDISLIEANQLVLYKERFCVDDTLMELKKYYDLKNEKKLYIGLIADTPGERTFIHNDPIRFRQIMTNLLNNAYKYTDHGYIRFGYHVVDNVVQFYVEDTGIGISEENRKNIFQQFHKIEPDKKRFYQGAGIGLSICERLVRLMGGSIIVESEIDVGSVFSFTLPFIQGEHAQQIDLPVSGETAQLNQIHVLIAEDEPDNFHLIERLLRKNNAKVSWAHNGKEAVEYFSTIEHPENHLVLMDIKMPVMNGFDACEAIKKINSKIPVIALTAFALAQDKDRIMKASFDNYISKPVIPERLRELLSFYQDTLTKKTDN